jgi:hypothetical protein
MYLVVFYVGEYGVGVWVGGCVYKIEKFRTLSAALEKFINIFLTRAASALVQKVNCKQSVKCYLTLFTFLFTPTAGLDQAS